jgi:hypothetical protein
VIGGSTRADVSRLVDESAVLRARLVSLVHAFQRRHRPSTAAKVGAAALALLGVGGAAVGAHALHRGRKRRVLMSPLRRRVRWALAAGLASLVARRFARRALAP